MIRMVLAAVLLVAFGLTAYSSLDQVKSSSQKVDLKALKATVVRLEKPLTFELVDTPLADVLKFLETFAEMKFGWDYEILPDRSITISETDKPLGELLQKVLDQCKWTYSIRPDGEVFLHPVATPKKQKDGK